jgi:endonuclease/exonuclease/phosphatase family metal-dependent hydrolase
MKINALSYNVHKLFDITGRKYFLPVLRDIISGMEVDLIFLQEVPGLIHGSYEKDFDKNPLEHLADELWDYFVYGKNAISTNRNHGNAILSKYPFTHSNNFNISNHRLEQRGFLFGKIEIENRTLALGCTHLDLTLLGRNRQVNKIKPILQEHCEEEMPLLICGDFNDWDGQTSKKMKTLDLETEESGPTFPSFFPVMPLDRIFYRHLICKKIRVLNDRHWKKLSDHLPMYAEFTIRE